MTIQMKLQSTIEILYGESGLNWIKKMPSEVDRLSDLWGLTDLNPVDNMTYNYVLSGYQDDQPIILKLSMDLEGLENEETALNAFKRNGCVQVISSEPGAMLMERAVPGETLKTLFPKNDLESVEILCQVMSQLHKAPIHQNSSFPHVRDWLSALDYAIDIPKEIRNKAIELRDRLLQSAGTEVLLHGDLHHDNILRKDDGWVVIDPKGVIGERAYEFAAFIRNPIPELLSIDNPIELIQKRMDHFSVHANLDSNRVRDWCFVQAVLCWAWALEDGVDANYFESFTQAMISL